MRGISSIITLIVLLTIVFMVKILDSIEFVYGIPFLCCILGFVLLKQKRNKPLKEIGKGIFLSSLTVLILLALFFIWLIYNFPK